MRTSFAKLSLLVIGLLSGARVAHAVSLTIVPADTTVTVGDTVQLRVVTTAFADLKGYQLIHTFDSALITLVSVHAGEVLTGAGGAYAAFVRPDAAAPTDSTWLDAAMLDGSASGPGVLAYLEFTATETGTAHVNCAHTEYRDSQNVETDPDCAGGVVRVTGPTAASRPSWGRVKSRYR